MSRESHRAPPRVKRHGREPRIRIQDSADPGLKGASLVAPVRATMIADRVTQIDDRRLARTLTHSGKCAG